MGENGVEVPKEAIMEAVSGGTGALCEMGHCLFYGPSFTFCPHGNDENLPICYAKKDKRDKLTTLVNEELQVALSLTPEQVGAVETYMAGLMLTKVPEKILSETRERNRKEKALQKQQEVEFQASLTDYQKKLLKEAEEEFGGRENIPLMWLRRIRNASQ